MPPDRPRIWQPCEVTEPPKSRIRTLGTVVVLFGLLAGTLVACAAPTEVAEAPSLRIATGPDGESRLLARTVALLLADAGIRAESVTFADGRSARQAIELGDVEVAIAYSGEEWLTRLGRANPPADPAIGLEALAEADRERGLTWMLPPAGSGVEEPPANATFAFFVAGPPAIDADLRTMSELSLRLSERPDLSLCVDTEFGRRSDGLAALLSTYSVRRDRPFLAADPADAVLGVLAGDCIAGLSHATDGIAWRAGLQPLVDDLRFFPAFVPTPVVRTSVLEELPSVRSALRPLLEGLSTGLLGRANGAVAGGASIDAVAADLVVRLRRTGDARP
jgi:osmoprotectant transport system substrate-binding protein